jgi:hypothetical protein
MQEQMSNTKAASRPELGLPEHRMPQPSAALNMPFKEHQLKQLRAQCLVFLAFRYALSCDKNSAFSRLVILIHFGYCCYLCRNNMATRKPHLDIALGLGENLPVESKHSPTSVTCIYFSTLLKSQINLEKICDFLDSIVKLYHKFLAFYCTYWLRLQYGRSDG